MMYGNNWGGSPAAYMFGGGALGAMGTWLGFLLIPFILWSLVWKGWALWKAAKNDSQAWFIALLIINTLGILEILYIFVFSQQKKTSKSRSKKH